MEQEWHKDQAVEDQFEGLKLTEKEKILWHLTADGKAYSMEQIFKALGNGIQEQQSVYNLIYQLRIKLQRIGQDIVCKSYGSKQPARYMRFRKLIVDTNDKAIG